MIRKCFLCLLGLIAFHGLVAEEQINISCKQTIGNTGTPEKGYVKFGAPKKACYDLAGNLYISGTGDIQKIDMDGKVLWTSPIPDRFRWSGSGIVTDGKAVWVSDLHQIPKIRKYDAENGHSINTEFEIPSATWWVGSLALYEDKLFASFLHSVRQVFIFDKNTGKQISKLNIVEARKLYVDQTTGDLYAYGWKPCMKYTKESAYAKGLPVSADEMAKIPALSPVDKLEIPQGVVPGNKFAHVTDIATAPNKEINPVNGDIAVMDEDNCCVFIFDDKGKYKRLIKDISPLAVDINAKGEVYMAGGDGEIYDSASGNWKMQLPGGQGIVCDKQNDVFYIIHDGSIKMYDHTGTCKTSFPSQWDYHPSPPSETHCGMAIAENHLYFSSPMEGKIKKIGLDLAGEPSDVISGLNSASGIAFDDKDALYVALESSVRKYKTENKIWVLEWERGKYPSAGEDAFKKPQGICVYKNWLYVADSGNNRIKIYTTDGELLSIIEKDTENKYPLRNPCDLALWEEEGKSYMIVANKGIYCLQKYEIILPKK